MTTDPTCGKAEASGLRRQNRAVNGVRARSEWNDARIGRDVTTPTIAPGEVAERSIATVLKTVDRKVRGFESHPLRQAAANSTDERTWMT
jgi:hypothetical protein